MKIAQPITKNPPTIAISMGDPAGIGAEIISRSLPSVIDHCRPIVFGHAATFAQTCKQYAPNLRLVEMQTPVSPAPGLVALVPAGDGDTPICTAGTAAAFAQFKALESAVDAVLAGVCESLVTGPVSKEWVAQISPHFTGHTEYLASRCGLKPDDVTMVFAQENIVVGLIATHVPFREILATITYERFERTVRHLALLGARMGNSRCPRIAVAALNPHGGENGLLGAEEKELLSPFCARIAPTVNADLFGPFPADTVFRDAFNGRYDGVVSLYHDQAMIPIKLHGFGKTVNVTMGLPFLRTSPDHGVAYDLAGKGLANFAGFAAAMKLAIDLRS